ncbi:MAG: tetratricopeptide repeat protein [Candidatus Cryptobacteroides sp.]
MKKIFIALALLLSTQMIDAQVKSAADARKAVEAAEAAAANPKKATKVATWLKVASTYVDAYSSPAGNGWVGAGQQELQLLMNGAKPVAVETVVLNGEPYTKEVYATSNYYYNRAGVLSIIEVTSPVYEDALAKALAAYSEAYKVDEKGSKKKDIVLGLQNVAQKYLDEGMTNYMLGDLKKASVCFENAAAAAATEPCSSVDSTAIYNAGFTAWMTGENERAKGFFEKCLDVKYYEDGEVYAKLADVYTKLGNKEAAKNTLESGFTAFPQSQSILIGLINYYIESNENTDRLFELLDEAKKNEPTNASLYYVEGNIHKQLKNYDAAVASYYKASEINPEYEFGYIGAGILYYEQAVEIQEKAQTEFDDAKYMKLVEEFENALINAIDPFEKAYAVSKDQSIKVNIAEYLKNIYYRFRDKDQKYADGYAKYEQVVSTGVAQ